VKVISHSQKSAQVEDISEHSPGKSGDLVVRNRRKWYGRRNFRIFGSAVYV